MSPQEILTAITDPLVFGKLLWPETTFYDKQREIIYSIRDSDETFVPAGNMLGKDYVAGFIALTCVLCPQIYFPKARTHEVRVVTSSVKDDHLRVLWGGRSADSSTRQPTP